MTEYNDSIIHKNLVLNNSNLEEFCVDFITDESNLNIIKNIKFYQEINNLKINNQEQIFRHVNTILEKYVKNNIKNIFIQNADINYILEKISFFQKQKFSEILIHLEIDNIINLMDYGQIFTHFRKKAKNYYLQSFYDNIINNPDHNINLFYILENHWKNINFKYLYEFLNSIRIGKKNSSLDLTNLNDFIKNKFDDIDSVKKLLDFIKITFIDNKESFNNYYDNQNKFNLFYVVNLLKSNGFLLFQEYEKDIIKRYSVSFYQNNELLDKLKNDLDLVKYFIFIISKNNNCTNKYVNQILLRTKNYISDLFDSFNNNIAFNKIKVRCISQKYADFDIDNFNRSIATFKIFKYSTFTPEIKEKELSNQDIYNLLDSSKLAPYFDIYKSFYKARYPDRDIILNLFNSVLIIKLNLNSKLYFIHLAIIQYIILDLLLNHKDGISAQQIQEKTGIKLNKLNSTFKSLFKIKLIKKNTDNDLYFINNDFTYGDGTKNKFSIANMVISESFKEQKEKEFAHDKETILQCNVIYFVKKNPYTTLDVIDSSLSYIVPFKYTIDQIQKTLDDSVKENYICEEILENNNKIYKFEEL